MKNQTYTGKAAEILDAAERHMRAGGYDAVSFRDLADDVGIKSSSVHYHFPQKPDLGEAVVRRYTDTVLGALGAPDDAGEDAYARIERLCAVYRTALSEDGLICLCCVLGAETRDLPDQVANAVNRFFERVLAWTGKALSDARGLGGTAAQILASLQGAMILAMATKQPALFDETVTGILERLEG
jgi:TetR/AcrR family transcriptional repressor of nem operon